MISDKGTTLGGTWSVGELHGIVVGSSVWNVTQSTSHWQVEFICENRECVKQHIQAKDAWNPKRCSLIFLNVQIYTRYLRRYVVMERHIIGSYLYTMSIGFYRYVIANFISIFIDRTQ